MPQNNTAKTIERRIRSFVLRTGRMTPSQDRAYKEQWPQFGLEIQGSAPDFTDVFGNNNELVLEIGFGMGDSLLQMAKHEPDKNFLGVEVHTPGVGRLLSLVAEQQLTNVRIYEQDAIEVIHQCIADNALSRVQIFFPDPWHKRKHHKRRIIQQEFVQTLEKKLKPGGILHLATDWQDYAKHMMKVMGSNASFSNISGEDAFAERPEYRPMTKFERRGENLGHGVRDLLFAKKAQ